LLSDFEVVDAAGFDDDSDLPAELSDLAAESDFVEDSDLLEDSDFSDPLELSLLLSPFEPPAFGCLLFPLP